MAYNPQLRTDDVLAALKGQLAIATQKHKVIIPAVVSASGKREVHELDVSDEGLAEIKRREEVAVSAAKKAYESITNDIIKKLDK